MKPIQNEFGLAINNGEMSISSLNRLQSMYIK